MIYTDTRLPVSFTFIRQQEIKVLKRVGKKVRYYKSVLLLNCIRSSVGRIIESQYVLVCSVKLIIFIGVMCTIC